MTPVVCRLTFDRNGTPCKFIQGHSRSLLMTSKRNLAMPGHPCCLFFWTSKGSHSRATNGGSAPSRMLHSPPPQSRAVGGRARPQRGHRRVQARQAQAAPCLEAEGPQTTRDGAPVSGVGGSPQHHFSQGLHEKYLDIATMKGYVPCIPWGQ